MDEGPGDGQHDAMGDGRDERSIWDLTPAERLEQIKQMVAAGAVVQWLDEPRPRPKLRMIKGGRD